MSGFTVYALFVCKEAARQWFLFKENRLLNPGLNKMDKNKNIVVLTDMRPAEMISAEAALKEAGYEVRRVPENVCLWDEEALRNWTEPFKAEITGVIHPAPPKILTTLTGFTREEWDRNTNEGPLAAFVVSKVFSLIFRETGGGAIIHLSSMHAERPVGNGYLFSFSCAAAENLCKEIATDYGVFHVRPYFVMRGPSESDPDMRSNLSELYFGVSNRFSERSYPDEEALNALLKFLLTDEAALLVGAPISADGGYLGYYHGRRFDNEGRPHVKSES